MSKFFRRQKLKEKDSDSTPRKLQKSRVSPQSQSSSNHRSSSNPVSNAKSVLSKLRVSSAPEPSVSTSGDPQYSDYEPDYGSTYDDSFAYSQAPSQVSADPYNIYTNHWQDAFAYSPPTGIKQVNFGDFELRFDFAGYSFLKQTALGIRDVDALLIYIRGGHGRNGFCVHISPDESRHTSQGHRYWELSWNIPTRLSCNGRQNRVVYQLSRSLWKYLQNGGNDTPDAVYTLIHQWLQRLPSRCITCGIVQQGVKLYRPTVCRENDNHTHPCIQQFRQSELEVRLVDIRQDPPVVELLLTSIYAAAQANNKKLLPHSPIPEPNSILNTLSSIPRIQNLNIRNNTISNMVRNLGFNPERLLCWASSQYRGFLISVPTGQFCISSLPSGIHQFLLADAGPELERKFWAARTAPGTVAPRETVFYHGTSLDRLYAILSQGLRVLSNDPLQTHGAAYGKGVYLTNSPRVALGYASNPIPQTHHRARDMLYYRMRVLLCVEVACDLQPRTSWSDGGIYVVEDESQIILRYVLLIPEGFSALGNEWNVRNEIGAKIRALRDGK